MYKRQLVGSGTTSKQLDREGDAKLIGYGGMLIECVLAVDVYKRQPLN